MKLFIIAVAVVIAALVGIVCYQSQGDDNADKIRAQFGNSSGMAAKPVTGHVHSSNCSHGTPKPQHTHSANCSH